MTVLRIMDLCMYVDVRMLSVIVCLCVQTTGEDR